MGRTSLTSERSVTVSPRSFALIGAAALLGLGGSAARAQFIPVYGGPTYDPSAGTGFQFGPLPEQRILITDGGVAVANPTKRSDNADLGTRPVRWDTSGAPPVELGHFGINPQGRSTVVANAINDAGTIVGYAHRFNAERDLGPRAVRWATGSTTPTELGHLGTSSTGYTSALAWDVNAGGTAVGSAAKNGSSTIRAVRWDSGTTVATELGVIPGFTRIEEMEAYAVNDAGTAVGYARTRDGAEPIRHAVRWHAGGTAATRLGDLGTAPTGYTYTYATAVDAAGNAFGTGAKFAGGASLGPRAIRWDAGTSAPTELGVLGTTDSGYAFAELAAVNAGGTAVGYVEKFVDGMYVGERVVRWDSGGTATTELGELSTLFGLSSAQAFAINSAGVVVGAAADYTGNMVQGYRAVLWRPDGAVVNLNTLVDPASGWTLRSANTISDTNFVAGVGLFDPDGPGPAAAYDRAFILDASSVVPEPTSFASLAVVGFVLVSRRRRRPR